MDSRIIVRLDMLPQSRQKLDATTERMGMTQVSLCSRLVEWLAAQPQLVQAVIFGHFPTKNKAEALRLILEKMERVKR